MTVAFSSANFATGQTIRDLPVVAGGTWARTLNKSDDLSVTLDLRDAAVRAAITAGAIDPMTTLILAEDVDSGKVMAVAPVLDHDWDGDGQILTPVTQGLGAYFDDCLIGPSTALTSALTLSTGRPNTALDTAYSGYGYGTIAKMLIQQRLTWAGSPGPWSFQADDTAAGITRSYPFLDFRMVGTALTDLQALDNGPDMRFAAARDSTGLGLIYQFFAGTTVAPRLGVYRGAWSEGGPLSPVTKFKATRAGSGMATAAWGTGAATTNAVLWSRKLNSGLAIPPRDTVDTSNSSVSVQATLDGYTQENANYAAALQITCSFTVRANANPGIGVIDVGDMVDVDLAETNKFFPGGGLLPIRITSIKGTDKGDELDIACVIWPRS